MPRTNSVILYGNVSVASIKFVMFLKIKKKTTGYHDVVLFSISGNFCSVE